MTIRRGIRVLSIALAALAVAAMADSRAQSPSPAAPQAPAPQAVPQPPALTPAVCELPSYLTSTDAELPRVTAAVKQGAPLDILVVGTGSSTLAGSDGTGAAWPKRLEQALRKKFPGFTINVSAEVMPRQSAEDAVEALARLLKEKKPTLVIWQTGTVDAMRNVHADDFRVALETGLEALREAGADAILMNLQYSPRTETMISVAPYLDTMRLVSQQQNVPLFDRFASMHHWSETGEFNLFGTTRDASLAKRVHDCIGRALALLMVDATKLGPNDVKVPR
jgi:hypothetical protein